MQSPEAQPQQRVDRMRPGKRRQRNPEQNDRNDHRSGQMRELTQNRPVAINGNGPVGIGDHVLST